MCTVVTAGLTLYGQPISVSHTTADPAVTIVSGTTSSDPYYKHFAFAELAQLANDPSEAGSAKRIALFGDQKYNPSLWTTLTREALLTLGHDYQLLLRRGAPPAAGEWFCVSFEFEMIHTASASKSFTILYVNLTC